MEQLNYNFVVPVVCGYGHGRSGVEPRGVCARIVERLLNEEMADVFFQRCWNELPYLSDEHFTVDGTLIEAWASHKSFRPKDGGEPLRGNGREVDFHGDAQQRNASIDH